MELGETQVSFLSMGDEGAKEGAIITDQEGFGPWQSRDYSQKALLLQQSGRAAFEAALIDTEHFAVRKMRYRQNKPHTRRMKDQEEGEEYECLGEGEAEQEQLEQQLQRQNSKFRINTINVIEVTPKIQRAIELRNKEHRFFINEQYRSQAVEKSDILPKKKGELLNNYAFSHQNYIRQQQFSPAIANCSDNSTDPVQKQTLPEKQRLYKINMSSNALQQAAKEMAARMQLHGLLSPTNLPVSQSTANSALKMHSPRQSPPSTTLVKVPLPLNIVTTSVSPRARDYQRTNVLQQPLRRPLQQQRQWQHQWQQQASVSHIVHSSSVQQKNKKFTVLQALESESCSPTSLYSLRAGQPVNIQRNFLNAKTLMLKRQTRSLLKKRLKRELKVVQSEYEEQQQCENSIEKTLQVQKIVDKTDYAFTNLKQYLKLKIKERQNNNQGPLLTSELLSQRSLRLPQLTSVAKTVATVGTPPQQGSLESNYRGVVEQLSSPTPSVLPRFTAERSSALILKSDGSAQQAAQQVYQQLTKHRYPHKSTRQTNLKYRIRTEQTLLTDDLGALSVMDISLLSPLQSATDKRKKDTFFTALSIQHRAFGGAEVRNDLSPLSLQRNL